MIFGINETDAGADSNGSGKSVLIEGVTIAFTGQTCRDVNKDEFINDSCDECFISLEAENKTGSINNLIIERTFYRKKSAKINIIENGIQNEQITSVSEANQYINDLVGLNRDDLLHFFIIGQETNFSFLTANDSEKKAIISRLSNSDKIDKIIDTLKISKKGFENKIVEVENKISKINGKIEIVELSIEDEKQNFKEKNKEEILTLKDRIKGLNISIEAYEEEKSKQNVQLKKLDLEIKSLTKLIESSEDIDSKIDLIKEKIQNIKFEKREANHLIEHLEAIESGSIDCPKCKHKFTPGSDFELSEIPNAKKDLEEQIKGFDLSIEKQNKKIESFDEQLNELKEQKSSLEILKKDKRDLNSKIVDIDDELVRLNKNISRTNSDIKELENSKENGGKIEDLKLQLKTLKEELILIEKNKKEFEIEMSNYDFWIYHFGKKGFTTYLSNKSVKVIEGVTNSYLKKFSSDLQVSIDGYTILKSGDLSEKINVNIVRNGRNVGSYKRYSGGEKGRINLANIVGLHKLINMSSKSGGLNFLALDEVFDGLDHTGQRDVIRTLEPLGITTLVVSHSNQPIGSENELFIKKINGESFILK